MIKKTICILLCFIVGTVFTACNTPSSSTTSSIVDYVPDYPIAINGVTVKRCPERVISLSPVLTDVVFSLGSNDRLVGVSDYCSIPFGIKELPSLGTAANPRAEQLIELNPEIVLTSVGLSYDLMEKLKLRNIPVVTIKAAKNEEDLPRLYQQTAQVMSGKIAGKTNADNTLGLLIKKLEQIKGKTQGSKKTKAALILDDPSAVATGDTLAGYVLTCAGAENVAQKGKNYEFSQEELAAADPDIIFCSQTDREKIKQKFSCKIVVVDIRTIERQGDSIIGQAEKMAKEMFPDRFSDE
ncbi:MAG: hypothetical protein BGN88_04785 [Clostridiales bacterium 43-6]|nr:MAG: hypothetical protein BGN88_04785 [Clostridiales bacterium 43-6]